MAKSLSKIMGQIEKLQKEAAAIQSTVIARIKREIAQHGLTAEHLFGSTDSTHVGNGRAAPAKSAPTKSAKAKPAGATKPAKFADDQGNAWGGMGKRPQWIRDALAAGRSLDEFLVDRKKAAGADAADATPKASSKVARKPAKKAASAKKAVTAKKAPASKAAKAARAAKPSAKAPAKKATRTPAVAKKSARRKSAPVKAVPASTDAGQTTA